MAANRYPGKCTECGHRVEAHGGKLTGAPGAWTVKHHAGDCITTPPPAPEPQRPDPPEGVHVADDGMVYRVKMSRESRRPYAQLVSRDSKPKYVGRSPFGKLSDDTLVTYAQALELSAQFGFCIRCGRALSAETSVAAGIGPVCGKRLQDQERARRREGGERTEVPNPYVNMNAVPVEELDAAASVADDEDDYDPNDEERRLVELEMEADRQVNETRRENRSHRQVRQCVDNDGNARTDRWPSGGPKPITGHLDAAIDVLDRAFPEHAN